VIQLDGVEELLPRIEPSDPGLHLAVVGSDRMMFEHAAGTAEMGSGRDLRPDTVFYVGSLAKQFVAACVALLARDGALSLTDPIGGFVKGLPEWAEAITLSHLIHHTGGLPRAYRPAGGIDPDGVPPWGNADLLEEVCRLPEPLAAPGHAHVYAGDGYLLLAEAIEAAAGAPLSEFAKDRIFDPLGMGDTRFRDAPDALPRRAARGHFRATDGELHVEPGRFHAVGSGGLWTTTRDLARWDANFERDRLADGWLPATLTTPGRLGDGRPIHYAWGLSIRHHRGLPIQSHGGSFPGWESKMVRFPSEGCTFILLANSEELDVSSLTFLVADHVLADAIDPNAPSASETRT
jgi:CubicO group peptidase (beta-lactamase class C family)